MVEEEFVSNQGIKELKFNREVFCILFTSQDCFHAGINSSDILETQLLEMLNTQIDEFEIALGQLSRKSDMLKTLNISAEEKVEIVKVEVFFSHYLIRNR